MTIFSHAERTAISSAIAMPLYQQVYEVLRQKIDSGELRHGDTLPSEAMLCEAFGIARVTAKRALDQLQSSGMVDRRRGRGTRVIHKYESKTLLAPLTSILESLYVLGKETQVEVIDFRRIAAPDNVAEALKIPKSAPVDRAIRVRYTNSSNSHDAFAYYISHTVPLGADFNARNLKQYSRVELFQRLGVRLSEVDQLISACAATPEVAASLKLAVGAPVLQLTRLYCAQDMRPVDHLLGYYRPDRFQYHMRLSVPERKK